MGQHDAPRFTHPLHARPRRRARQGGPGLAVLGALLALVISPMTADAREWFVSTTGSDDNDGSLEHPFRSIGHVLSPGNGIVADGDTVTLRAPAGNRT